MNTLILNDKKIFPGVYNFEIPTIDGLIAATASTHNLILVTRNESDFAPAQITLINPWKTEKKEKVDSQKKEVET